MEKFKVGDIVKPNKGAGRYSITNGARMKEGVVTAVYAGKLSIRGTKWFDGSKDPTEYSTLDPACFDLVRRGGVQTELHIMGDGKTVHAVLKENGKVVKRAKASCDPRDEYNFETGARLATDRVFGKEAEKKEPTYKFNIGDTVLVHDPGKTYSGYREFMKRYSSDIQMRWVYKRAPKQSELYTVVERGLPPSLKKPLYVIQVKEFGNSGEVFLISEDGLALKERAM